MGTEQTLCDLCGTDDYRELYQGRDRLHHLPGIFPVVQCRQCGLVYLNPRPDQDSLAQYYPNDYSPFAAGHGLLGRVKKELRQKEAKRIGQLFPTGGRVLEIGCAGGDLLVPLRDVVGLEVAGIEMSPYAADLARGEHALEVHTGTVFDAPYQAASFDGVVMRHVVEHFPSPRRALEKAVAFLRPGGILIVSTPNFDSFDRRVFGRFWYDFDTPRHLTIFSVTTLTRMLESTYLQVKEVKYSALPNDWVHSLRYLLEDKFGRRSFFRLLSLKNPLGLLLFAPMGLLQKALGLSGRMEITAVKVE